MIATIRDIAIIVLAVETILFFLVLIMVAWQVWRLIRLIRSKTEELSIAGRGVLDSAKQTAEKAGETATSVKGSAEFISDTMVSPVVQVVSAVAGARGFVSALFRVNSTGRSGGPT